MDPAGSEYHILNPDVYLNFLTQPAAAEFEVARNIYIATLGASCSRALRYMFSWHLTSIGAIVGYAL